MYQMTSIGSLLGEFPQLLVITARILPLQSVILTFQLRWGRSLGQSFLVFIAFLLAVAPFVFPTSDLKFSELVLLCSLCTFGVGNIYYYSRALIFKASYRHHPPVLVDVRTKRTIWQCVWGLPL